MKRLRNRHGETLIEALVSMLIIALTTAMLTMTVATVLRSYQQAEQIPTFVDERLSASSPTITLTSITDVQVMLKESDGTESQIGKVTVKQQKGKLDGGLYYYAEGTYSP